VDQLSSRRLVTVAVVSGPAGGLAMAVPVVIWDRPRAGHRALERCRPGASRRRSEEPRARARAEGHVEDNRRGGEDLRLSSELRRELKRLRSHPIRELGRLEHEADAGENPAALAILIAGMALSLWTFVALVVVAALLFAHLVA
jgi:hypothetical protein